MVGRGFAWERRITWIFHPCANTCNVMSWCACIVSSSIMGHRQFCISWFPFSRSFPLPSWLNHGWAGPVQRRWCGTLASCATPIVHGDDGVARSAPCALALLVRIGVGSWPQDALHRTIPRRGWRLCSAPTLCIGRTLQARTRCRLASSSGAWQQCGVCPRQASSDAASLHSQTGQW